MRLIYALLVISLFGSCASTNTKQIMQSWIGHHQADLFKKWGQPIRTNSDGKDGQILTYEFTRKTSTSVMPNPIKLNGETSYTVSGGDTYVYYRHVFVDKDGIITLIRWGRDER